MLAYHDREWGVPLHGDRELFAKLVLDGFQAGLSWAVILHKRARFLEVFDGFDPERMARYDATRIARLLRDPGSCATGRRCARPCRTPARSSRSASEQGRSTRSCGASWAARRSSSRDAAYAISRRAPASRTG